jgi:hypothetical protein
MTNSRITIEQVQEFMAMLTGGELPEGMTMADQPDLSPAQAFSVIWYLQEHLRVLPDNIEMCAVCGELFDSHRDGQSVDGVRLCSTSCEVAFLTIQR